MLLLLDVVTSAEAEKEERHFDSIAFSVILVKHSSLTIAMKVHS
jgi:hypothetical protein